MRTKHAMKMHSGKPPLPWRKTGPDGSITAHKNKGAYSRKIRTRLIRARKGPPSRATTKPIRLDANRSDKNLFGVSGPGPASRLGFVRRRQWQRRRQYAVFPFRRNGFQPDR